MRRLSRWLRRVREETSLAVAGLEVLGRRESEPFLLCVVMLAGVPSSGSDMLAEAGKSRQVNRAKRTKLFECVEDSAASVCKRTLSPDAAYLITSLVLRIRSLRGLDGAIGQHCSRSISKVFSRLDR